MRASLHPPLFPSPFGARAVIIRPGGLKVIKQTVSREDALIAHTRRNAFFVFQENNLGSIQSGKQADLLITAGNPLADVHGIENVQAIYLAGARIGSDLRTSVN